MARRDFRLIILFSLILIAVSSIVYSLYRLVLQQPTTTSFTPSQVNPESQEIIHNQFSNLEEALQSYSQSSQVQDTNCDKLVSLSPYFAGDSRFSVIYKNQNIVQTRISEAALHNIQPKCFVWQDTVIVVYPQNSLGMSSFDTRIVYGEAIESTQAGAVMSRDGGMTWSKPYVLDFINGYDFSLTLELSQLGNGKFYVFRKDGEAVLMSDTFEFLKRVQFLDYQSHTNYHGYFPPIFGYYNRTLYTFERVGFFYNDPEIGPGFGIWSSADDGKTWQIQSVPETNSNHSFVTLGDQFGRIYVEGISQYPDQRMLIFQPLLPDGTWGSAVILRDKVEKILAFDQENQRIIFSDLSLQKRQLCSFYPIVGCWTNSPYEGPLQLLLGEIVTDPMRGVVVEKWGEFEIGEL